MSFRTHKRRKLKAEINVVPYIDVMLVLLIIFMVTAPLLNLGIDVDLPEANAKPVQQTKEPVTVSVRTDGSMLLSLDGGAGQALQEAELLAKVGAFVRSNPNVPVYIAADGSLSYQDVMQKVVLLQTAGVTKVALVTQPVKETAR